MSGRGEDAAAAPLPDAFDVVVEVPAVPAGTSIRVSVDLHHDTAGRAAAGMRPAASAVAPT